MVGGTDPDKAAFCQHFDAVAGFGKHCWAGLRCNVSAMYLASLASIRCMICGKHEVRPKLKAAAAFMARRNTGTVKAAKTLPSRGKTNVFNLDFAAGKA